MRPSRFVVPFLAALVALASVTDQATGAGAAAASPATARIALGAYAAGFPGTGSQVAQLESQLGSTVAVASSFRGWGDLFPDATQRLDGDTGHTLLVAWDLGDTPATRFSTFPSHAHDSYLAQEAAVAKAYGRTLYVRPWAEMNGDWSAFQPTPDGSRPAGGTYAQFVAAWRYVVDFFRNHGATNVRWVFNPTTDTYAETTPITAIWPGSAWVDVLGLDGYNWGTGGVFTWRSFGDIVQAQYSRLTALDPTLPVWICETGSKEPSESDGAPADPAHSKAAWYRQAMTWLAGTRVRALVLFDTAKERDWRVASDPAALDYLRSVAASAAPAVAPVPPKLVAAVVTAGATATSSARVRVTARVRSGRRTFTAVAVANGRARRSVSATASARAISPAAAAAQARSAARARAAHQADSLSRQAARRTAQAVAHAHAVRKAKAKARAAARRG